jgi:hypothetical protein
MVTLPIWGEDLDGWSAEAEAGEAAGTADRPEK